MTKGSNQYNENMTIINTYPPSQNTYIRNCKNWSEIDNPITTGVVNTLLSIRSRTARPKMNKKVDLNNIISQIDLTESVTIPPNSRTHNLLKYL